MLKLLPPPPYLRYKLGIEARSSHIHKDVSLKVSSFNYRSSSVNRSESHGPSSILDYRRINEKKNLAPRPDGDATFIVHPKERLGLDYDLNAVLNSEHRLTPVGDAFRNLYQRNLIMYSRGRLDAQKALNYKTEDARSVKIHYVAPSMNHKFLPPDGVNSLGGDYFRSLGSLLSDFIGDSDNIFVLDAAIGSHRLGQHLVRIISDSSNLILYLQHMLPPQPKKDPYLFNYDLTVYIATKIKIDQPGQYGLESNSFVVSHPERGILLIGGIENTEAIMEAIVAASSSRILNDEIPSLPIRGHVLESKQGRSAIVIDPSNLLVKFKTWPSYISGFNGLLWNNYGIYRMFQGITHDNPKIARRRGDLVETVVEGDHHHHHSGKTIDVRITQPLVNLPNEIAAPTSFMFVVRDITGILPGLSKMTPKVASNYLAAGYEGNPNVLNPFYWHYPVVVPSTKVRGLFEELSDKHNTTIYMCNVKRKDGTELSQADLDTILLASMDGSLSQLSTTWNECLKCHVINSVPGVGASLDTLQGWDQNEYITKAKKFARVIGL